MAREKKSVHKVQMTEGRVNFTTGKAELSRFGRNIHIKKAWI